MVREVLHTIDGQGFFFIHYPPHFQHKHLLSFACRTEHQVGKILKKQQDRACATHVYSMNFGISALQNCDGEDLNMLRGSDAWKKTLALSDAESRHISRKFTIHGPENRSN